MQDPKQIWEFGRWIARREIGSARLSWTGGEIVLGVRRGRIHTAEGLDTADLAERLGCEGEGNPDLLAEARALSQRHGIAETQAMGTAKEILQRALTAWMIDPDRGFELVEDEPVSSDGATISVSHAVVELVLADTEQRVANAILPDGEVQLRRADDFLELYPPLRLSEEADLIVAGITGSVTAEAVASSSVHGADEVLRLVSALVATGMLHASEPAIPTHDLDWPVVDVEHDEGVRRRIPVWLIGGAAAVLLVVAAVVAFVMLRGGEPDEPSVGAADWGVVVEMGCEPKDLQRMLRKRNTERKSLRTVKADATDGDDCFRLVWGSFPTRDDAERSIEDVPSGLVEDGFQPHVIEVSGGDSDATEVEDL